MKHILLVLTTAFTFDSIILPADDNGRTVSGQITNSLLQATRGTFGDLLGDPHSWAGATAELREEFANVTAQLQDAQEEHDKKSTIEQFHALIAQLQAAQTHIANTAAAGNNNGAAAISPQQRRGIHNTGRGDRGSRERRDNSN